ncbi:MAG: transcription termination/antitermination protein NusG [Bacillota bacterium]
MENGIKWYVIHTYSGYENKVQANLEKKIKALGLEDKIVRVLVPMEEKTEIKGDKTKTAMKKIFPGYVLIEMEVTDQTWYVVRNTPGVTGFVGSGNKPIPLSDEELSNLLRVMGLGTDVKLGFECGDLIEIIEGPFMGIRTQVLDILDGTVKVNVNLFGRETAAELDYKQIKKID